MLNLLECAAREPKQKKIVPAVEVNPQAEGVSLRDRMSLVEKCVTFYKRLLDIKYAGTVIYLAMHCITTMLCVQNYLDMNLEYEVIHTVVLESISWNTYLEALIIFGVFDTILFLAEANFSSPSLSYHNFLMWYFVVGQPD